MTWPSPAPNSDLARRLVQAEGLPAPTYVDDHDHRLATQWAEVLIGLAIEAFGDRGNGNCGSTPSMARWCPVCECGWTGALEIRADGQRGPVPCWFCDPQPAPSLILLHAPEAARG